MSVMEIPPSIAGVDGADQSAATLEQLLNQLDAHIWADRQMSQQEQRLLAAWMYMQKQKIVASQQQAQAAAGGEEFQPGQGVPEMEEEPLTAGAPGAGGGDSGYEGYQP